MAAEVADLREAAVSIEELEAEVRQELDRKYAFYRMLQATDVVLEALEQLNLHGVREVPAGTYRRIHHVLRDLPACALEALRDSERTQEVLDSVFDCQETLFLWHDPKRVSEDEESAPLDEERTQGILALVGAAAPNWLGWAELARHWVQGARPKPDEMDQLVRDGLLLCEMRDPSRGPAGRFYALAGEAARA